MEYSTGRVECSTGAAEYSTGAAEYSTGAAEYSTGGVEQHARQALLMPVTILYAAFIVCIAGFAVIVSIGLVSSSMSTDNVHVH
ncbi:MAG: hypothetical protein HY063_07315 [Bacteroidetes bacterium]|nr:hypothetical protein [Bacteroidota bacterium]